MPLGFFGCLAFRFAREFQNLTRLEQEQPVTVPLAMHRGPDVTVQYSSCQQGIDRRDLKQIRHCTPFIRVQVAMFTRVQM